MKNSVQLNDKYVPLFTDKSRYFVVTGGRGSQMAQNRVPMLIITLVW